MTKVEQVFKALRTDYVAIAMLVALLNGVVAFLIVFGIISFFPLINITLVSSTMMHILLSVLIGFAVFIWSAIFRILNFSYVVLEKDVRNLEDVLHTAQQYKNKQNALKEELFKELEHRAADTSTSEIIPYHTILKKSMFIFVLAVVLLSIHHAPRFDTPNMNDLLPQFVKDTQSRFGIDDRATTEIRDDDSIYGDATDRTQLERESIRLRLHSGATGGDLDNLQQMHPQQPFENLFEPSNIQAIVEHTEVQQLPQERSLTLARLYSREVRQLQ